MSPPTARGTFRTATTQSTLDYYLVSDQLAAAVDEVATIQASGIKSHVPVMLRFKPRVTALKALHVRRPPTLEFERVHGPLPPPPPWQQAKCAAEEALRRARCDGDDIDGALATAYRLWIDNVEHELGDYAGKQVAKHGTRGQQPKLVWRSVVPERPAAREYPTEAAVVWMRTVAMELQRIGAFARAGMAATHADGALDETPGDQMDDEEDEDELDSTDDIPMHIRRKPTTLAACRLLTGEIARTVDLDLPDGDAPDDVTDMHSKLVDIARRAMNTLPTRAPPEGMVVDAAADAWGPLVDDGPPARWSEVSNDNMENCQLRLLALRATLDEAMEAAESSRRAADNGKWRYWIHEGLEAGASRAHAFSRSPIAWTPTAVKAEGGAFSSRPDAMLNAQREKYKGLWKPANGPIKYRWGQCDELPILGPEERRSVTQQRPLRGRPR